MVIKRCKYKGLHILKKGLSWLRPQEKSSFWSPEDVIKARSLESGQSVTSILKITSLFSQSNFQPLNLRSLLYYCYM